MPAPASDDAPLIVDLDGTLTLTDTLAESLIQAVKARPSTLLKLPFWLARGRAAFKQAVASQGALRAETLPYRSALLAYLKAEKARGRRVVLATAADQTIARAVAAHHDGLFDDVIASDGQRNLKGRAKLEEIVRHHGNDFVYAGDSRADLPIWQAARAAVLAGATPTVATRVKQQSTPIEREFPNERRSARLLWLKALRVHQWLKNLLIFVPLLTAFSFFDARTLQLATLAFISLSLGASASYLLNDLWDLDADRVHPRKRLRPFASAALPVWQGVAYSASLLAAALLLAIWVSPAFTALLVTYLAATSLYSWALKKRPLIDVILLSMLYTLRIYAGAIATGIALSKWLFAFSLLTFLSLALVKRCAELVAMRQTTQDQAARGQITSNQAIAGRDYRVDDLETLRPLGIGAAFAAVVVFCLFISDMSTSQRYGAVNLLWLACVGFVYLMGHLWLMTNRGQMHDDPVVYVIKNSASRYALLSMAVIAVGARFFHFT